MSSTVKCDIVAVIAVNHRTVTTQRWGGIDVMKTSISRGWTRGKFNRLLREAKKDEIVTAHWRCVHKTEYHTTLDGFLSGVNGRVMREDGVFER